jgi:hypothetical protein
MPYRRRTMNNWADPDGPLWDKEKIHAQMERERQLVEAGRLDDEPTGPRWPFTTIGILLAIIALCLAIYGITQFLKLRAGGEWRHNIATITSTTIVRDSSSKNKDSYDIRGVYTYSVKGHEFHFTANQDSVTDINLANSSAPGYIGRRAEIWYNPDSPGQIAYFPLINVITAASFAGALIVLVLGILFLSRGSKRF